jgi:hypothetical protein
MMPPDPNDKMEELLKACASKRREQSGAPFELHPATRKLLQDEVARLAPRLEEKAAKTPFLFRLLFTAAAASVAICAIILFKSEPPASAHKALYVGPGSIPSEQTPPVIAPAGAPATAEQPASGGMPLASNFRSVAPSDAAVATDSDIEKRVTATRSALAASSADQTRKSDKPGGKSDLDKAGITFSLSTPVGSGSATGQNVVSNSLSGTDISLDGSQSLGGASNVAEKSRQESAKKFAAAKESQMLGQESKMALAGVLTTFQLQLEGDNVRLIDADGSTYSGKIEQPLLQKVISVSNGRTFTNIAPVNEAGNQSNNADQLRAQQSMAKTQQANNGVANNQNADQALKQNNMLQQNFSFRATGISRRLNKPVTFEGNYIAADVAQGQPLGTVQTKDNAELLKAKDVPPPQNNNARIQGEAQVGDSGTVDIDAVVVPLKTKAGN